MDVRKYQASQLYNDFFIGLFEQVDEVPFAKLTDHTETNLLLRFSKKGNIDEARKNATDFLNGFVKQLEVYEKDNNPNKSYDAFVPIIMQHMKEAYNQ